MYTPCIYGVYTIYLFNDEPGHTGEKSCPVSILVLVDLARELITTFQEFQTNYYPGLKSLKSVP